MSVKASKAEPVKGHVSLSIKPKQDVKLHSDSSPSSSSSTKASRSPFVSRKTSRHVALSAIEIKNAHREATKISSPSKWTGNFILMVELRRKIIAFRGIIDLPPLTGYLSITNMVMRTMKDLHKLCPAIIESSQLVDIRHANVDKLLDHFYNALKSIGDSWIDDHEWIIKSKYRTSNIRKNLSDQIVEKVLAALDGLIKGMNERLSMTEITPRSVLKPPSKGGDFAISVSNLRRNVRMQTLVKLSPVDVKRLAIQNMFEKETQRCNGEESAKEKKSEIEKIEKAKEDVLEEKDCVKNQNQTKVLEESEVVLESLALPPPPQQNVALPPPSPPPMVAEKGLVALPPPPPPILLAAPLPPPPGAAAIPPPPSPSLPGRGPAAPPPPPLGAGGLKRTTSKLKRSRQLGSLYNYLKAILEGKNPEARTRGGVKGSKGGGIGNALATGKQGMADALAEIAKKSLHFQRIEEDVQMYMKSINELKTEISKFKNKNITELQTFHCRVESVLGNLDDETQVLARCEGFPQSKLETIRMAAALSSKLHGIVQELKNWKIESPVNQVFDKTERYFAKIRKEIETLDQTKVEDEKKFKNHNIYFDFNILVQIKELMVDISSGCMELALKEKREAKIASHAAESREVKASMKINKTSGCAKMLWRAFQFAYRVYTFAGGHDDRADKLTRELADEIKQIL